MSVVSRREFEALQRDNERLRQELAKRPIRHPAGGAPTQVYRIVITGGNTLATGQAGIKYQSSQVASVPSAYDPTVTSSFIDGIGRGDLYINGTLIGKVLVVCDSRQTAVTYDLLGGTDADRIDCPAATVAIPIAGDPDGATVAAYVPDFL